MGVNEQDLQNLSLQSTQKQGATEVTEETKIQDISEGKILAVCSLCPLWQKLSDLSILPHHAKRFTATNQANKKPPIGA